MANSRYGGFISGRPLTSIDFGPQTLGYDNYTLYAKEWLARLAAHAQSGYRTLPAVSAKRSPASTGGATGSKVSGAMRISGGSF